MVIRRIEDIERDKDREKRENFKNQISGDINDVINNVFSKPKKRKPNFIDYIIKAFKWIVFIFIGLTIINLILGNIWLFKFFIKEMFTGV